MSKPSRGPGLRNPGNLRNVFCTYSCFQQSCCGASEKDCIAEMRCSRRDKEDETLTVRERSFSRGSSLAAAGTRIWADTSVLFICTSLTNSKPAYRVHCLPISATDSGLSLWFQSGKSARSKTSFEDMVHIIYFPQSVFRASKGTTRQSHFFPLSARNRRDTRKR